MSRYARRVKASVSPPISRFIGRACLGGFVVAFAGCVHYRPAPLSPEATRRDFESRSLADPRLREFIAIDAPELAREWPRTTWDLATLTLAALYFRPDVEAARARLAAAEAAVVSAGARPNPTVGFSPAYNANTASGVSPWTLGFSLGVPIETAGRRGYRVAQAQHAANSARLALVTAAWQARSRVRRALIDWQAATSAQEVLARQQLAQSQIVELLEARRKAGQSSSNEVQLVRVAAGRTALGLRDAQRQAAEASARLAEALAVPEPAVAALPRWSSAPARLPPADEAGAPRREALLNRADVLGALADYDASQSALQLEIAKQYPDVHLGPGYSWDQGEKKFALGVSLALPLFNRNAGPIAEAEARRREAAARFAAVQARAIGEVEVAFVGYRDALRKLETADALLEQQRARLKSAEAAFAAGAADRVEWLQAQAELGANELARAQTLVESQRALAQLEDAMQRPTDLVEPRPPLDS